MTYSSRVSVPAAPSVYEVEELEELLSGDAVDTNEGDWYAIRTDPWPCPACGEVFDWVTACHHVVVSDSRDDLIDHAARCAQVGRSPKIVRYEDGLPTITIWQWRALGRPVHGIKR